MKKTDQKKYFAGMKVGNVVRIGSYGTFEVLEQHETSAVVENGETHEVFILTFNHGQLMLTPYGIDFTQVDIGQWVTFEDDGGKRKYEVIVRKTGNQGVLVRSEDGEYFAVENDPEEPGGVIKDGVELRDGMREPGDGEGMTTEELNALLDERIKKIVSYSDTPVS